MRTFDFDRDEVYEYNAHTFIALGEKKTAEELDQSNFPLKLVKETANAVPEIWGTLGWADDSAFRMNGTIDLSINGNTNEGGNNILTAKQVADLKAINPLLTGKIGVVRERFINFDNVEFDLPEEFVPEELPKLRLTLFLQPDEGALVYYEHHEKGNFQDNDAFAEYIMYEKEAEATRDRLHYCFTVEPKYKVIPVPGKDGLYKESNQKTGLSFTIKILTYKQAVASEDGLFKEAVSTLNGANDNAVDNGMIMYELVGKDKYNLLRFDPKSADGKDVIVVVDDEETIHYGGRFLPVENATDVNVNSKTLLLIHGTFVNTIKSFHDVIIRRGEGLSYLQHLLSSGKYEQILAFDHPTLSQDASQNMDWLKGRMNKLGITFEGNALDVLTTSRGALVAEYMAADPACAQLFPMRKVLMFSAANGSGYFKTGKMISAGLSVWKKSASGPAAKIVLALLQFSVDYILRQPGAVLMTIGHKDQVLESILSAKPNNPNLIYKTIVSDWDVCLMTEDKWLKRAGATLLDVVIKANLGAKNDWVIGCSRQDIVPEKSEAKREPSEYRRAVHGRYLRTSYVKDMDCVLIGDPHVCIENYFQTIV